MDNLFYVNVSESEYRNWEDCKCYGFLAAGGSKKRINQISSLAPGNYVAAYLKSKGYVGIGLVEEFAVPIDNFLFKGEPLSNFKLTQPGIFKRSGQHDICDHLVRVKWLIALDRTIAKWEKGLFATQNVKASLHKQRNTVLFLENAFQIDLQNI